MINYEKMKAAFYNDAIMQGFSGDDYLDGPVQIIFDWVNDNTGGESIKVPVASVDVVATVATVRIEIKTG